MLWQTVIAQLPRMKVPRGGKLLHACLIRVAIAFVATINYIYIYVYMYIYIYIYLS